MRGPKIPRLMIFTDNYPPYDRGGAGRMAYYHAKGLCDRGWKVGVVCNQEPGRKISGVAEEEGITVYRLFQMHPFSKQLDPLPIDKAFQLSATFFNPFMRPVLKHVIKDFAPDLLHAHQISRISYGAFTKLETNLPRFLTFHTYHFECPKGGLFRKKSK